MILVGLATLFGLMAAYSQISGGKEDLQRLKEYAKLFLYNRGFVQSLSPEETYRLYQQKCYRRCHGEAAMITAILPPAGWMQIVERMRVQQGVAMTGKEAEVIIHYMDLKYPSRKSSIPYAIRRKINKLLWRNDVGYGDVYADINFGTKVYFDAINARSLGHEYEVRDYLIFIISLTVHEGKVKHYPMDKMTFLRVDGKEYPPADDWQLRLETADGHHVEGLLRFSKKDVNGKEVLQPDTGSMELVIKNLETVKDRIYHWDLPIPYPEEYEYKEEEK